MALKLKRVISIVVSYYADKLSKEEEDALSKHLWNDVVFPEIIIIHKELYPNSNPSADDYFTRIFDELEKAGALWAENYPVFRLIDGHVYHLRLRLDNDMHPLVSGFSFSRYSINNYLKEVQGWLLQHENELIESNARGKKELISLAIISIIIIACFIYYSLF